MLPEEQQEKCKKSQCDYLDTKKDKKKNKKKDDNGISPRNLDDQYDEDLDFGNFGT